MEKSKIGKCFKWKFEFQSFFKTKKPGFFLKLGSRAARFYPRAGPDSPTFELAGTGGNGPQFFKIMGRHGQRAAFHGLLTSSPGYRQSHFGSEPLSKLTS